MGTSDTRAAINHLQLLSILIALIQLNKFSLYVESDEGDFYIIPKVLQKLQCRKANALFAYILYIFIHIYYST